MAISKRLFIIIPLFLVGILLAAILASVLIGQPTAAPKSSSTETIKSAESPEVTATYEGSQTVVAGLFSVKIPNGWMASTSSSSDFIAIMFARPEQLSTLTYHKETQPTVSEGIAAWNGLTEHFFIRAPSPSQQFSSGDHQEVSSEDFTFDDGTLGQKYLVIKHAEEAKKWGGLLRDTEWQGRTYIYKKEGITVEAHLAVYPASNLDIAFFESVVRTITAP